MSALEKRRARVLARLAALRAENEDLAAKATRLCLIKGVGGRHGGHPAWPPA